MSNVETVAEVLAEMRQQTRDGWTSDGRLCQFADRIERALCASADVPELMEALEKLLSSCDDSDAAQYGTLSTSFVRSIAEAAIANATRATSFTPRVGAVELAATISVGRQEVQKTHPALPTFYQTRINFGGPDNPGNTVALVFGNNSTSATEQLAFAEKLVRCYNQNKSAMGKAMGAE